MVYCGIWYRCMVEFETSLLISYSVLVHNMMTSSNGNFFRVTGYLWGEFPTQRPVTRSFDVYFDLRPDKRLSKQLWGWWFETLSHSLWRHRNELWSFCKKVTYIDEFVLWGKGRLEIRFSRMDPSIYAFFSMGELLLWERTIPRQIFSAK